MRVPWYAKPPRDAQPPRLPPRGPPVSELAWPGRCPPGRAPRPPPPPPWWKAQTPPRPRWRAAAVAKQSQPRVFAEPGRGGGGRPRRLRWDGGGAVAAAGREAEAIAREVRHLERKKKGEKKMMMMMMKRKRKKEEVNQKHI